MYSFNCGTDTLPYPSCNYLVDYCNNNYNYNTSDDEWCNCMSNPSNSAITECSYSNQKFIIGCAITGMVGFILFMAFTIKCAFCKNPFTLKRRMAPSYESIAAEEAPPPYDEINIRN